MVTVKVGQARDPSAHEPSGNVDILTNRPECSDHRNDSVVGLGVAWLMGSAWACESARVSPWERFRAR